MIKYIPDPQNFRKTQFNTSNNSLLIDGAASKTIVGDVTLHENELLTTYLPHIIDTADTLPFSSKAAAKVYYENPKRLSQAVYGVVDYWYLILAVNNFTSIFEFTGFTSIIAPDSTEVDKLISSIERKNKK